MPIDIAHYHGWKGRLHSPWRGALALVRVALLQVFRRKAYWLVLTLGLMRFVLFWSVIYAVTQLPVPPDARERILETFGFSASPTDVQETGYLRFLGGQGVVVILLLAFSGSLIVGADFQHKSLPFYLSRRIDRRHYIVGKLAAVGAIVSLLTVVPAMLLFVEYGMFTTSAGYWRENWRIPVAILFYGGVLSLVLSILLVSLAARLQRTAPIAVAWCSLFLLPLILSEALEELTGSRWWNLLDLWRNIRLVGRLCFGQFRRPEDEQFAYVALGLLAALCTIALLALVKRVRAVDIVQ